MSLPIPRHTLNIAVEWPLPGAVGWTDVPTAENPWRIALAELLQSAGREESLSCNSWLAQQLVMFDRRGIALKDVIRMVATYEGAHSINESRLLQAEDK